MTPDKFLEHTTAMADNLHAITRKAAFVGLPKEKVGGKVYGDGMTVFRIGAIHEYGATFTHPGGTRFMAVGGKAKFVSNSFTGPVSGVTKPHQITIPQRSFLRTPFATKRKVMNKAIAQQFVAVANGERKPLVGLGRIGAVATNISKGAFTSKGYGQWRDITAATKQRKGSSQTLVDTGILKGSINYVIR